MDEGFAMAGGAFRHFFNPNETINDIDIFVLGDEKLRAERIRAALDYFNTGVRKTRYIKKFQCPELKLVTYFDNYLRVKIQIINEGNHLSLADLLNSFDFNACRFGLEYDKRGYKNFMYSKQGILDVKNKQLSLFKLEYPVATIKRVYKYQKYGYKINDCLVDIVTQLNDPNNNFEKEKLTRVYID
jgi:hypothetical protein